MKVIDKIKKLLSLAGNNPSDEEAKAAMMKAQDLLAENDLSLEDVDRDDDMVFACISQKGKRAPFWWKQMIANIIANNFRCVVFIARNREEGLSGLKFIGHKLDLEVAISVTHLAIHVADHQAKLFVKSAKRTGLICNRKAAARYRNDFLRGWGGGLRLSFRTHVATRGNELALVRPKDVQKAVDDMQIKNAPKSKVATAGSVLATMFGQQHGETFQYRQGLEAAKDKG